MLNGRESCGAAFIQHSTLNIQHSAFGFLGMVAARSCVKAE
jgi:hypothetical protein